MAVTHEDEERFESFKELINTMDIDTFVTIDIESLMIDYMAGRYEITGVRVSWYWRAIRFVLRWFAKPKKM
jgi:hypothetical protein